jgi:cytidylate kinase
MKYVILMQGSRQMTSTEKTIVTVSRQYGSGGREVGKKLAEMLGLAYYDKELIARAAEESGLGEEFFESNGEQVKNRLSYLFAYAAGNSGATKETLPLSDRVFIAQAEVIKQIADEGGCVIIGRCSDYVLDDRRTIDVFIHADWEARIDRVMKRNSIDRDAAIDRIRKTDKRRATYYQHYTDRKWGDVANYDISVSTSSIGIDNTVKLLARYIEIADAAHDD